jgi:hypothetical protein
MASFHEILHSEVASLADCNGAFLVLYVLVGCPYCGPAVDALKRSSAANGLQLGLVTFQNQTEEIQKDLRTLVTGYPRLMLFKSSGDPVRYVGRFADTAELSAFITSARAMMKQNTMSCPRKR